MPVPARHLPMLPLPPYAYQPGLNPHPTRDPGGHLFGRSAPPVAAPDPPHWRDCAPYLYGIDLFNHGYYWEAHEAWESLWHACGRSGPTADFLRGLIRLAAAAFKQREGRPRGRERHAQAAATLFDTVAGQVGDDFMGVSLARLTAQARAAASGDPAALTALPVASALPDR